MQRIATLLQKLTELSTQGKPSQIDIDLMLDYTRVIYADLLEERKKLATETFAPVRSVHQPVPAVPRPVAHVAPVEAAPLPEAAEAEESEEEEQPLEPEAIIDTVITQPAHIPDPEPTPAPTPMHTIQASVPDHDIRTVIGINDKYLFINELFKDDKAEYDHVIKQLNTLGDAKAAGQWLDEEIATKHNWDKEQQTVQDFYALVNSFFPSM